MTTLRLWTLDEIEIVKNNGLSGACALLPSRTRSAIETKRRSLGLTNSAHGRISPSVWRRVAALLREGRSHREISKLPRMPTPNTIANKIARDPRFAEAAGVGIKWGYFQISPEKRLEVVNLLRAGHTITEIGMMKGQPDRMTLKRWRILFPEFDREVIAASPASKKIKFNLETTQSLISAIGDGLPIRRAAAAAGVANQTVDRWRKQRPKFNRAFERARGTIIRPSAVRSSKLITASDHVLARMRSAVPATLPQDVRDDVVSSIYLALVEGRLLQRDIESRVREFVTAHYRMFTKFAPGGGGIMRSLDEPAYLDSPTPLIETVTQGLWI